jgi:mannose-6-phosphate isomerase-like protein (cupin superfamily)
MAGRDEDPCAMEADELELFLEVLAPLVPPPRDRFLGSLDLHGRLDRFAPTVSALVDLSVDEVRPYLDRVWDPSTPWEVAIGETRTWWIPGGPRVQNAIRGFVHMPAGEHFPVHRHLGDEQMLILQGHAIFDDGSRRSPGDLVTASVEIEHAFTADPRGLDLLLFVVTFGGVEVGDRRALPRD